MTRLIILGLTLIIFGCAKTVTDPVESPYILKFQIEFNGSINLSKYHYFFLVGNQQFPERNENYQFVPMYVPGFRPGEISEHEIEIRRNGILDETKHLEDNTAYLSTWSDIITHSSTTTSFQRCSGPFGTPQSFLELLQLCESNWSEGGLITNAGTTSTTMKIEIRINGLSNGSNDTEEIHIAILTLDKINPENFQFNQTNLVDFASGDQGIAEANVKNKTNVVELYSSSCSQVDSNKLGACVKSIQYQRTR